MVKFKDLVKESKPTDPADLYALFNSLDRRTSHIDARPAQEEALHLITERRDERDLVLKLSTGAGKTAAGLLYLQSHMLTKEEPAVYLCPTVQLVDQVCSEARNIGIQAVKYPAGETYPHFDGTSAKAIIICTYEKLFNGQSTFNRDDVQLVPCAIVLDDAHVGLDRISGNFTLEVADPEQREAFLAIVEPGCKKYNPARWKDITDGDPRATLEVPFWVWKEAVPRARELLANPQRPSHNWFVWPLVGEVLRWCRCIISGVGIEIIPDIPPVERCPAYHRAAHRLFMSATLADDSLLVRELGCSAEAAKKPIRSGSDRGVGERMVLAPSLIEKSLDRDWVKGLCRDLASKHRVVVLCANEASARSWEAFGATVALGEEVLPLVQSLRDPASPQRFVALAQRYDGVDLPDDSCRVLVLDGLPHGAGIADRFDSSLSRAVQHRLIHRIEQGMGRAVRSHADYAVVLLAGPGIAHFIARREVLRLMNPDTRAQLELALELAKLAAGESDPPDVVVKGLVHQCLGRDPDWKRYYDEKVREPEPKSALAADDKRLVLAAAERRAFALAVGNDPTGAVTALRGALNEHEPGEEETGIYLQKIANYMHETDPGGSFDVQRAAYEKNRAMLCPPTGARKPASSTKLVAEKAVLNWFQQFDNPKGAIAAIEVLRGNLSYANDHKTVEQALLDLSPLLGAEGSRPEQEIGEGPDDVWLWPAISLVIEAKGNDESLHKKDAGQLVLSLQWFERAYPTRETPVALMAAKVEVADRLSDFPDGTRVLTREKLETLLDRVEAFYKRLVEAPLLAQPQAVRALQQEFRLLPENFVSEFTVPLREMK